jgi:large subunit ribosomal protein L28
MSALRSMSTSAEHRVNNRYWRSLWLRSMRIFGSCQSGLRFCGFRIDSGFIDLGLRRLVDLRIKFAHPSEGDEDGGVVFLIGEKCIMSRVCELSGKSSLMGHRVSHSNIKTNVRLQSNLQSKRIFVPSLKRHVRLRLSTAALRTLNRIGIEAYAARVGLKLS